MLHPTEKYYPLRPELAESTFYLYQATKGLINFFINHLHFDMDLKVQAIFLKHSDILVL